MTATSNDPANDPRDDFTIGLDKSFHVRRIALMKQVWRSSFGSPTTTTTTTSTTTPLTRIQIQALERLGNTSPDWSLVQYLPGCQYVEGRIRHCHFHGSIRLGTFSTLKMSLDTTTTTTEEEEEGDILTWPSGLYHSTFHDVLISSNVLIRHTAMIAHTLVATGVVIFHCQHIGYDRSRHATSGNTPVVADFGNDLELPVGIETGGRDIRCWIDLSFDQAKALGKASRKKRRAWTSELNAELHTHVGHCGFNILDHHASLLYVTRLDNVYIGSFACVQDQVEILNSSLSSVEPVLLCPAPSARRTSSRSSAQLRKFRIHVSGASQIHHSLLQVGSRVSNMSLVEHSFCCESSHVSNHGKLFYSLLGPNSGIAEGEVTSCFVGPFVGFHHQALLIATFWPEGKGNVGYGANVGSNHTLKAPDQELWPGEGLFFGLGVNIKFPSNFIKSPYSVIATGVMTLPQKLAMPFSLINIPSSINPSTRSPAINEIFPGWVITHAMFSLLRNEWKFKTRNESTSTDISSDIFARADLVSLCLEARAALLDDDVGGGKGGHHEEEYQELRGMGKNYMTEASRKQGITAYTFFIHHALYIHVVENLMSRKMTTVTSEHHGNNFFNQLLREEFQLEEEEERGTQDLVALYRRALASYVSLARMAESGKHRDDRRGQKILPDYLETHRPARDEPIVIQAQARAKQVAKMLEPYLEGESVGQTTSKL